MQGSREKGTHIKHDDAQDNARVSPVMRIQDVEIAEHELIGGAVRAV